MSASLIALSLSPGFGALYQGGWADSGDLLAIAGPMWLVNLCDDDGFDDDSRFVDGVHVLGCLPASIPDTGAGVMADDAYLTLLDRVRTLLRSGVNVYVHCLAGWSRSSYVTVGLFMVERDLSYDDALARVRQRHAMARPNPHFEAHLRRIEPRLRNFTRCLCSMPISSQLPTS
jgi:hypothetical protein